MIGCYADAHNTIWDSSDIKPRGRSLIEYRKVVIGISLATQEVEENIVNWRVSSKVTFSDHKRIEVEMISDVKRSSFTSNIIA